MLSAMRHLLRLSMTSLHCIPAFFRSRNEQALVELALRQARDESSTDPGGFS
jgi:hypothetical protein